MKHSKMYDYQVLSRKPIARNFLTPTINRKIKNWSPFFVMPMKTPGPFGALIASHSNKNDGKSRKHPKTAQLTTPSC